MHKPQCHSMQSLSGTSVKAIIYKLFVFTKMGSFQYLMTAIAFVIEQHMTDMFHVDTNLMSTSCFKYTFHKGYVSQSFQYAVVCNGMFAHCRIGHHRHLHPVSRITGNITDNRSFILFHNTPHQSTIFAFGSLIKKLNSQICFGIRCLGNHQ